MKFPTNFAHSAVAVVMVVVMVLVLPQAVSATDIETADGRRFVDCRILKVDQLGLYFRHSKGIARVLYEDLSEQLLAALEPLPEAENESALMTAAGHAPALVPPAAESKARDAEGVPVVLWQRVVYVVPWPKIACCPSGGIAGLHRHANLSCRKLVELDFLITSGLVPRPPGVVTRRLPLGWRYF